MRPDKKKKLVILGGGIGSLVTAWHLTSQPNWKEIYESITVYQTGWRLGGKCASGRGPNGRIEEHGLHIWFGFYDNSFDVIQNAYAMLGRPPGSPLAAWSDAFEKHSYFVIAHQFKDQWYPWEFDFPVNDRVPGRGSTLPNLWQYISLTIDFIVQHFERSGMNLYVERRSILTSSGVFSRLRQTVGNKVDDLKFAGKTLAARILSLIVPLVRDLGDDRDRARLHRVDADVGGDSPSPAENRLVASDAMPRLLGEAAQRRGLVDSGPCRGNVELDVTGAPHRPASWGHASRVRGVK